MSIHEYSMENVLRGIKIVYCTVSFLFYGNESSSLLDETVGENFVSY